MNYGSNGMKLTIRLPFHTRLGQMIFLCGDRPWFGDALPLHYADSELWEVTLDLPDTGRPEKPVSYHFFMRDEDGSVREDFGGGRRLNLAALPPGDTIILDSWIDLDTVENVFLTEPFKNVLLRAPNESTGTPPASGSHEFHVLAPLLAPGQTICLLGSTPALGQWNQSAPILLQRDAKTGDFSTRLDLSSGPFPLAYKYGVYDTRENVFVRYEDGANRTAPAGHVIMNDGYVRLPSAPWKGAGVAIPVFSLRSEHGFGVGEFLDLPLLADWANEAGLKLIQILPVNDTSATHSWTDSYPYAAISVFALHPLYLNLDAMAGPEHRPLLEKLADQRRQLNALPAVDYEAVMKAKLAFARTIFAKTAPPQEQHDFASHNEHWLTPYTAFCFLRDKFGTADFNQWPEYRAFDANAISALAKRDAAARDEMAFHAFLQFHLHTQLRDAVRAVHDKGLVLKGDMAIGVHPHGADVWQQPELFHTDMQAGAPPDAFAAKGQNWGFPTYQWPRMKQDGFAWWRARLAQMSSYFDAFRIDHILGFFRIWSIPRGAVEGILGYFVPAVPVRAEEFAARGIAFNHERYARPFIDDGVLGEIFGSRAEDVKREFLDAVPGGMYSPKPAFATQREVERHFTSADSANLKEGLFDLISNVLLIEAPGGGYHFRLGMEQTPSFRRLDANTQWRLKDLYIDYFFRRQEERWRREAMEKLPALKRVTNMLICGEDLGMVPACVPAVMRDLGLLSLEIQRMPKALNAHFSRPDDAPYLSVVTPATHDMSAIRGWWREDRNVTQEFFNTELAQPGPAPLECETWINREVVRQHLDSPAMWSIFQLQDMLGMDETLRHPNPDSERINVPAIVHYYWRYRMHLSLETLAAADPFTQLVKNMVQQGGRFHEAVSTVAKT